MPTNPNIEFSSYYQTFSIDEESLLDTEAKIESFSQYADGWCYGEGLSFSDEVRQAAIELNNTALLVGLLNTDAFPGPDGEILVSIYHNNINIDIYIFPNLVATFVKEENNTEVEREEEISLDEAEAKIIEFAENIWLSDYSLSTGTTEQKVSGRTGHSNYQLLSQDAA